MYYINLTDDSSSQLRLMSIIISIMIYRRRRDTVYFRPRSFTHGNNLDNTLHIAAIIRVLGDKLQQSAK